MSKPAKPSQMSLLVWREREIEGIKMGVLSDGTAYLSGRGLARLCDVAPSAIITLGDEWRPGSGRERDQKIEGFLRRVGYAHDRLYIEFEGKKIYEARAVSAVLEYYAFEAKKDNELVRHRYRALAAKGMQSYIYEQVGYTTSAPPAFQAYHDRLLLNPLPTGWFSVFSETSGMVLDAIRSGLRVDEHTVPDISVGSAWARYWEGMNLESKYGGRHKYPHKYPDYMPQGANERGWPAWIYPMAALGEFHTWLQTVYLPDRYPNYIGKKVSSGAIDEVAAKKLLAAVVPKALPH